MPRIPVYERQAGVTGIPDTGGLSMAAGGAVGQAIQGAASGLNAVAGSMREVEERDAASWVAKTLAEKRLQWGKSLIERQATEPLDGFTERALGDFDKDLEATLATAPSDLARSVFQERGAQFRAGIGEDAFKFEFEGRLKRRLDDLGQTVNLNANVLVSRPGDFAVVRGETHGAIAAAGLSPEAETGLKRDADQKLALSALNGLMVGDPARVGRELASGAWDKYIAPNVKAAMLRQSENEVEQRAAKAESDANKANALYLERLETGIVDGSVGLPDIELQESAGLLPPLQAERARQKVIVRDREKINAEKKRAENVARVSAERPLLDPKAKGDREAVDDAFAAVSAQWSGEPEDVQRDRAFRWIAEKGIIPSAVESGINAGVRSTDPARRARAADDYARLVQLNPGLKDDLDADTIRELEDVVSRVERGHSPEQAARDSVEAAKVSPQIREARAKEFEAVATSSENFSWLSSQEGYRRNWISRDVNVTSEMTALFERELKAEYVRSGNLEGARRTAFRTVTARYGATAVGEDVPVARAAPGKDGKLRVEIVRGARTMANPPEKYYSVSGLSAEENGKWMNDQLRSDMEAGAWVDGSYKGRLSIAPHPTRKAPDGRPAYSVTLLDAEGGVNVVRDKNGAPVAWYPDWNRTPEKARRDAEQKTQIDASRARRDAKSPLPALVGDPLTGAFQ